MVFNFSEDYLYGRLLFCEFEFDQNEDVTEMTHNLFKNFNATNNQFDLANFEFSNDGETSNFMFDYATSGHLEVKVFALGGISGGISGILPMTESAILGSINSLEGLLIDGNFGYSNQNLAFSENFLFAMGLLKLKVLYLDGFDWNKFQLPQETFNTLESFNADLKLEALPEMPNLKQLSLFPREETSLTSEVLKKVPNLEYLYIDGKLDPLWPGTFEGSKSLEYIDLYYTNVTSIDLTGLRPSTIVDLSYSSITNLPEQNFRQFIEGAVRNYILYQSSDSLWKMSGKINLSGNPLECSCDFKWLCDVPYATDLIYEAECADGTTLESAIDLICNQC